MGQRTSGVIGGLGFPLLGWLFVNSPCSLFHLIPALALYWAVLISRSQNQEVLPHLCMAPSPATSRPFSQHFIASSPWLAPQLSVYLCLRQAHQSLQLLGFYSTQNFFRILKWYSCCTSVIQNIFFNLYTNLK